VNFGGGPLTYVGDDDMFLLRLAAAGTHLRSESHGSLGADRGTSLAYAGTVLAFGGYYNSGIIDLGTGPLPDGSGYDAFVAYLTQ